MSDLPSTTHRLLDDIMPFIAGNRQTVGVATPVPRLTAWTSSRDTLPTPAVFEPLFYAVLRGIKVLIMGANTFDLAAGTCAVSSIGTPYTHQLTGATRERPYVGVSLHLDTDLLARVVLDMPKRDHRWTCSVAADELNGALGNAFARLVGLVNAPEDVGMLAPHYEAEFYYRLLQSSMGDTLRQIGQRGERFQRLKATADWLASNFREPIAIADLAAAAGMSGTSFHRHFKAVTGHSPLAFQRKMRLMEARKLLSAGDASISRVGYEVGYLSPSQFSREYKSMFGASPRTDLQR
jgi:AraC-like DNA-binding protein